MERTWYVTAQAGIYRWRLYGVCLALRSRLGQRRANTPAISDGKCISTASRGYTSARIPASIDEWREYVTSMVDYRASELLRLAYQIFLGDQPNGDPRRPSGNDQRSERHCAVSLIVPL
jgi:hypothetical protein